MAKANNFHYRAIAVLLAMLLALPVMDISNAEAKKRKSKVDFAKGEVQLLSRAEAFSQMGKSPVFGYSTDAPLSWAG